MGDGEKLLTYLNSALKVLLGLDIFPRVPQNKLNFVDQCYLLLSLQFVALNTVQGFSHSHNTSDNNSYPSSNPYAQTQLSPYVPVIFSSPRRSGSVATPSF